MTKRAPNQRKVISRRSGRRVILEPLAEWTREFLKALGSWNEEIELPPQRSLADLRVMREDHREA